PKKPHLEWKRLKVWGYALVLIIAIGFLFYNIGTRSDTEVNVQQTRQPLYVTLSDGSFRNRYQVHIVNKTEHDETYDLSVRGIPTESLDIGNIPEIRVRAGKSLSISARVDLSQEIGTKTESFDFVIQPSSPGAEPLIVPANFNCKRDQ